LTVDPLHWLFSLERLGMKFGLENLSKLMKELGDPHVRFPSVLVAGTNGKGSVTATVDAALSAAGILSARYTSPHLLRIEERFVIGGREVDTMTLANAVGTVRTAVDALLDRGELDAPATFFECATAAAFLLFASTNVDIAVLEVGLGGRLDATNVVTPLVTAITTIDLDHQAQLGSTIRSIAAEKAGIIKARVPVVIGRLTSEAEEVVRDAARALDAPVISAQDEAALPSDLALSLQGAHQRDNALVALAILKQLSSRGFSVGDDAIAQALTTVRWPGRLERMQRGDCEVLLDAAHNPAGARALATYLRDTGWTDATLVFGAMSDKDAQGMLDALLPIAPRIIFTTASTPRAARAAELARLVPPGASSAVEIVDDPEAALSRACASAHRVVVAGSMFLIGPLRGILR
jgi:dihydrofolate synthase/folylpolyglutamate synthase